MQHLKRKDPRANIGLISLKGRRNITRSSHKKLREARKKSLEAKYFKVHGVGNNRKIKRMTHTKREKEGIIAMGVRSKRENDRMVDRGIICTRSPKLKMNSRWDNGARTYGMQHLLRCATSFN